MERRADHLVQRIRPYLPREGRALDIGCGTGHNAVAILERFPSLEIKGVDVVDMSAVGSRPTLFDGLELPFSDLDADIAWLFFVLHLPDDPVALLREVRRVTSDRLIVIQSTHRGFLARAVLMGRSLVQGQAAFEVARWAGLVAADRSSLRAKRFMDRESLREVFDRSGWQVIDFRPEPWRLLPFLELSRDLYVLRPK